MSEITLREYIEATMKAHAREHELIADALELSRTAIERRLNTMNEMREQITAERGQLASKEWVASRIEYMEARVMETRTASRNAILVAGIAALATIIGAAIALLRTA